VDVALDVAPAVLATLAPRPPVRPVVPRSDGRPRRSLVAAAAVAAVAGLVAGAAFVGIGREPRSPAAADLSELVLAAQTDIDSVDAHFRLTERGLPGGGDRRFHGHLIYEAPESLALTLRRSGSSGTGLRLVVDGENWWQSTTRACSPAPAPVACPGGARPWVRSVSGREPFSETTPVPLELISPVDSFRLAATPTGLGTRTIAGRRATGVAVTAAQVAAFLDGLSAGGDVRAVHPGDPVELWLDADQLVPLQVTVRAGASADRARWASGQGATEGPGDTILDFTVTSAAINEPVTHEAFAVPARPQPDERVDAGFRTAHGEGAGPAAADPPAPADLPDGFRPYRSGTSSSPGGPDIAVGSWTDGRAWLTVRSTREWSGDRLFGGLGTGVRAIDLGHAGLGYVSDDGRKVAVHDDGVDAVVGGSVSASDLRAAAASLGLTGRAVPRSWDEAATSTLAEAAATTNRLLVARGLEGFGPPAVRIADGTVTQVCAGAGDRGFVLVQSDDDRLAPPADGDAVGVDVRGAPGRYSVERGQLEWVEDGTSHSLSSRTLSLDELLAIAAVLESA
jgi:hypothetical protein